MIQHYEGKQFVNIGTGSDISIKEVVEKIKMLVGYEGEIFWDSSKPDGTPRKWMDVSKLHQLGWKHQIDLEEGIQKTYQDFMANYDQYVIGRH